MKHCLSLIFVLILMAGCTAKPLQSDTTTMPASTKEILTDTPEPITKLPTGWISFDSKQDGVWGIYLIKVDGSEKAQPLTVHQKGEYWSAWSPDGQKVAFSSYRDSFDPSTNSAIYIVNTDGTGLKQVTDNVAKDTMPAWSPNGKKIAFSSDRDEGNTDVYLVNVDGTGLKRLTDDPAGDIWPSWSPDGNKIAFASKRSGNWQIHIMNADGTNITQLTDGSANANSAWSPDGKQIAFISGRDGNSEIYVMDVDGSNVKRLTNDPGRDDYPTWSPDGQFIAFVSDRAGNLDVYVMRKDGSDVKRITDEPTDEYPPKWAPANVTVKAEPRFGTPYCLRDTNNDGMAEVSTKEFPQNDQAFFVSFPYDDMHKDLEWSVQLVSENEAYTPISYSANWGEKASGIMTLRLGNMTGYEITGFGHGVGMGPLPPGSLKVQLFIEENLVQEIECEVVPTDPQETTVPASIGPILYVKSDGTSRFCDSWENACGLQTALAAAKAGDEIWVKAGIYKPDLGTGSPTAIFRLKNEVAIYGGFEGTETARDQRDWQTNITVLSGDLGGDDQTDPNGVVTNTANIVGENSYHVVLGSKVDNTAILDGFVITAGYASQSPPNIHGFGGGMIMQGGSPTLTNLVFSGNTAGKGAAYYGGGGMYISFGSNPILTHVTFVANTAGGGAGMYNDRGSNPVLNDVTFSGNKAIAASCMGNYANSNPIMNDVIFDKNSSSNKGCMLNEDSNPIMNHVTFSNNSARYGAAMYNYRSSPTLTDVVFSDNIASHVGGAMENEDHSNPVLTNVLLSGNSAYHQGGGIFNIVGSNPILTNVAFINNKVISNGGGSGGGGMHSSDSSPSLTNVTFSGNHATVGGGINNWRSNLTLTNVTFSKNTADQYGAAMYSQESKPVITNSIIWGNSPSESQMLNDRGVSTITHSIIVSGHPGTGNLKVNPKLGTLADNGGFALTYSLLPGSPAIDAGNPSTCPSVDQRDLLRPIDGDGNGSATCDIGAFEYDPKQSVTQQNVQPTATSLPALQSSTAPQTVFLRSRCGTTYNIQAGNPLEIQYGAWLAVGREQAVQNAQHLNVRLLIDGKTVDGIQQPVVAGSELPCVAMEGLYGVFFSSNMDSLSKGTQVVTVTWIFDEQVTDGYDANGDGIPDTYGPGEIATENYIIIVK